MKTVQQRKEGGAPAIFRDTTMLRALLLLLLPASLLAVPQPWDLLESEWAEKIDATCQTCPSCPPSKWPCHFVCCDPRVTPTHKRETCPDGSLCCECGNPAVRARLAAAQLSPSLLRLAVHLFLSAFLLRLIC